MVLIDSLDIYAVPNIMRFEILIDMCVCVCLGGVRRTGSVKDGTRSFEGIRIFEVFSNIPLVL